MEKANIYMIDKACIDTLTKYNKTQLKEALYNYITDVNPQYFSVESNRKNIASIHPIDIKRTIIEDVLMGRIYKDVNDHSNIPNEFKNKNINDLNPNELQFLLSKTYQKDGIQAVDAYFHNLKTKEGKELFLKLADCFIEDRYINKKVGFYTLDNFKLQNPELITMTLDIGNYYNNQKENKNNKLI